MVVSKLFPAILESLSPEDMRFLEAWYERMTVGIWTNRMDAETLERVYRKANGDGDVGATVVRLIEHNLVSLNERERYELTSFGYAFVSACQPPD